MDRIILITAIINLARTRPLNPPATSTETLTNAMMYLMKYGYMDGHTKSNKSAPLLSRDGLRNYVEEFQSFAGLAVTGELDQSTLALMRTPRCGVKDVVGGEGRGRSKRFALQGSRWKVKTLTYKISKYPTKPGMSKRTVDREIRAALNVWSDVSQLEFVQKTGGSVHIDVRFEDGEHGDGDPFDGSGGTLAHAYFPVYGGDAHFDNAEDWTAGSHSGTNLLQTAAHEFGHSLGLSHSDQGSALMAPFYRGFQSEVSLEADDLVAVQALYGPRGQRNVSQEARGDRRETERADNRLLCLTPTIDTIFSAQDGDSFVSQGEKVWKLTDDSVAPGYPKKISDVWEGLPARLDAAFTYLNGKSYFFRADKYWRFSNGRPDAGYPKLIRKGFDGIPDNVDAAFVWSGNEKIYFFKGKQYWKFDPEKRPPVDPAYPRPISNWEGIPDDIDAALRYDNGYTYFFKQGSYYRFDDMKFKVDKGDPPFPRPASKWWFGCEFSSPLQSPGRR